MKIGIIGYGEVGTAFARDLRANGASAVAVYDVLFENSVAKPGLVAKAEADGIRAAPNLQSVIDGAEFVFSAVTASAVEAVAAEAAQFLKAGQVFLDLNSASPATKRRAAVLVAASGADYVEGAVMAPIAEPRLQVPILGGGPAAARTADALNALGMNIRPVSEDIGKASAMKLCRSIMIKGYRSPDHRLRGCVARLGCSGRGLCQPHANLPLHRLAEAGRNYVRPREAAREAKGSRDARGR